MPPNSTATHRDKSSVELILTSENGFVCVEFTAANTEYNVTERAAFKQRAEIITQPTVWNFDRCTARLTGHVHSLTDYTDLTATSAASDQLYSTTLT